MMPVRRVERHPLIVVARRLRPERGTRLHRAHANRVEPAVHVLLFRFILVYPIRYIEIRDRSPGRRRASVAGHFRESMSPEGKKRKC
jgi:hypothetical protein